MESAIIDLSKKHIERLIQTIEQAKQMIDGHTQKIKELKSQLAELEVEKETWSSAVESVNKND